MKKTYILSIMFFALAVAGCKKNYLDQSVNPNQPSAVAPGNVLSGAEEVTVVRTENDYATFGIWMGYYAPSGNFVPSTNTETYTFTNASFNVFNPLYLNIANYVYLNNQAKLDPTLNNYSAIASILSAYDYQMLVDNYGDVPYTQAVNSSVYLFPAYDKGQDIYNGLMTQLDGAIALINSSGSAINPGAADIIFGGAMAKWKKFANTLKLRIALRQSNITANKPALVTELAKTTAEGYLDDVTFATAQPGYLASDANGGQQNPYYKGNGFTAAGAEQSGHSQNRANTFFINFLLSRGTDTVRLKQIYTVSTNSNAEFVAYNAAFAANSSIGPIPASHAPIYQRVVGNTFGQDATNLSNTQASAQGNGIIPGPTVPAVIIGGAEACYLLSEAIAYGWIPGTINGSGGGTAQDYYERGIKANFVALGATTTQAATYYSQPIVDVNWVASAANLQRAIITQKYIACFGYNILEAYNEFRRTGYPDLSGARSLATGANGSASQNVPARIFWPSTEQSTNLVNYNLLPSLTLATTFTTKLFWAK